MKTTTIICTETTLAGILSFWTAVLNPDGCECNSHRDEIKRQMWHAGYKQVAGAPKHTYVEREASAVAYTRERELPILYGFESPAVMVARRLAALANPASGRI